jgi:hypothetical protein
MADKTTSKPKAPAAKISKPGMSRTVRILYAIGVLVLIIVALLVVPSIIGFSPSFCGLCHTPSHGSWENSTHKNIACSECHIPAGFTAALKTRLGFVDKISVTIGLTTGNNDVMGFEGKPKDDSCNVCHKQKRNITPSGDLIIPHASHTKLRKIACADCHNNMVHTKASMAGNKPSMAGCYKCHDGETAPNQCSNCHTEKALPPDHKAETWLLSHDEIHASDPAYCDGCHGWIPDYCDSCHATKPRSHDKLWPAAHQSFITTDRKEGCAKCHGSERCRSCHVKKPKAIRPKL